MKGVAVHGPNLVDSVLDGQLLINVYVAAALLASNAHDCTFISTNNRIQGRRFQSRAVAQRVSVQMRAL